MDNWQEHPVDVEKEEMAATIRELNRDLDLHDIIVSTYKSEIKQLQAEVERYVCCLKLIKNSCFDYMEGAGEPEFGHYNTLFALSNEALQGKKGCE